MDIPKSIQYIRTGRASMDTWLKNRYPEFYDFLLSNYDSDSSIREKVYMYYNEMNERPRCKVCGGRVKFHGMKYGFSHYCGSRCAMSDPDVKEKYERTYKSHWGDDWKEIKAGKMREGCKEKYGVDNAMRCDEVKEKRQKTYLEKYGVSNPMQSASVREKRKVTCEKRYGVGQRMIDPKYAYERSEEMMKKKYQDFLRRDGDGYIFSCPDPDCKGCEEREYKISYNNYYERRFVYDICPCTKKVPLGSSIQNNKNTNIEVFVKEILDEIGADYLCNDRNIISPYELDFYIPSHHLAIECNGCYWHGNKDKMYHYNKFISCEETGVQLLTLWEDQIESKPGVVRSIILSKLGVYDRRLGARECVVREVGSKECRMFLEENHLQGGVNSSLRLGLYRGDELVCVMTFGKKRRALGNKGVREDGREVWELYRFCNKRGVQVIGGVSKLFKYFIRKYDPMTVESFSSNDISIGKVYEVLGFKFKSESISYWYTKGKKRYHRYMFRKSELVKKGYDKEKTEFDIMKELHYNRIYDTGQKKWIYNKQ